LCDQVINWKETLKIPREPPLSQPAKELILRLCCGADERLGRNGAGEIKTHSFFLGVDFDTLRKQQPPYVPQIRYATDTSNFDPVDPDKLHNSEESEEKRRVEKTENGRHPEHAFFEFTFRRFFDDGGHPMAASNWDPNLAGFDPLSGEPNPESNSPVYV
jgi:serine/threonine-protein kinase LATS1/2